MSLTECKECKHQVSTTAQACPGCGAAVAAAKSGVPVGGLVYLALVVAAFVWIWGLMTPDDAKALPVSQAEMGDAWPLTVDQGELRCEGSAWVTFTSGDQVYAVNGSARGHAAKAGWLDVQSIWRSNPAAPGLKITITPLIDKGLTLCKS